MAEVMKADDHMTEKEMLKISIEEFDRLQDYMQSCDKESEVYKKMKRRYKALKVILTASGINLQKLTISRNSEIGKSVKIEKYGLTWGKIVL